MIQTQLLFIEGSHDDIINYLYSQSNMECIGNIDSKIYVSPKLNLIYKCCRRFRFSLNH